METDHAVDFLLRPLLTELAARLFSVYLAFLRCTRYSVLFLLSVAGGALRWLLLSVFTTAPATFGSSAGNTQQTRRTLENYPPLVWVLHLTAKPRSRAGSFSRTAGGFPHLHVAKGARFKSWTVRGLHHRTLLLWIRETSYVHLCVCVFDTHPPRASWCLPLQCKGNFVPWGKMSVSCDLWSSSV